MANQTINEITEAQEKVNKELRQVVAEIGTLTERRSTLVAQKVRLMEDLNKVLREELALLKAK